MDILSIQSAVLHGMVGNNAAIPVLHSLGWAPLALHTAWYTQHKGHPGWFGAVTDPALFARVLQHVWEAPHLRVTTVLSGYLATAEHATLLARALPQEVCYVCDPVIGDMPGGVYVSADLVHAYRTVLVPRATVLLPNHFELSLLADRSVQTTGEAIAAARALLDAHPALQMVIVKGVRIAEEFHLFTVSRDHLTRTQHPVIPYRVSGTGDAFSAAWLGLYLHTGQLHTSLTYAGEFVHRAVRRTAQEQQSELQLLQELGWLQQALARLTPRTEPVPTPHGCGHGDAASSVS